MNNRRLENIELQIVGIKRELSTIGEMRPGSLTRQSRKGCAHGEYYQLSYTHLMKGKTEYVRAESAPMVRSQIANFHRFRKLSERWVRLAIMHARVKRSLEKKHLKKGSRKGGKSK